ANGGLIISDDLGSKAVRDFYSLGGDSFSPRLVARDAFLAGNDLLYLGNLAADQLDDPYQAALRILDAFAQDIVMIPCLPSWWMRQSHGFSRRNFVYIRI
ncbi:MAG: hypothetical protein CUN53_20350, partial [Phototrophicales bacterium]